MALGGPEILVLLVMLVIIGAFWVAPIVISMRLLNEKGRGGGLGFALGFFLGWIGVLVAALLSPIDSGPTRACPFCAERIKSEATVCRWCQRELPPPAASGLMCANGHENSADVD